MPPKHSWRIWILYIFAVFAVYGAFVANPFLMDDEIQILSNQHVQNLTEWPTYFTSSTMDLGGAKTMGGIYYKPLMTSYFAICWNLFGRDPAAFRAPLWVMQATSAFLIFLFSLQFLSRSRSFALGLLFLLHPVNAEPILYIADAQDVLYFFFGMSALTAAALMRSSLRTYLIVGFFFACALLSKETGALFLGLTFIYIWLFQKQKVRGIFITATLVTFAYAIARWNSGLISTESPALLIHHAGFLGRLSMLPLILAHYFEILVFPWRISLSTDFVLSSLTFSNFYLPIIITFIAVLIYVAISRFFKKRGQMAICYFFTSVFVLWFILHSNLIIPLDAVYVDRWLLLLVWCFLSLGFLLIEDLNTKLKHRKYEYIGLGIIVSLFVVRDIVRANDWSEPIELYRYEYALHPWDALMANNVGVELFGRGDMVSARSYFKIATENNPNWNVSWSNLGVTYEREGNYNEALKLYNKSNELGVYPLAVENIGKLLCGLQRFNECREHVQKYLPNFPFNPTLRELDRKLNSK